MSAIKRYIENEAERLGVTFDEVVAAHEFHPTPDNSDPAPSCFTCKHVHSWHHSASREEPEDSGWECNHPDQKLISENWVEPIDRLDDEQLALYCAQHCPGYEFSNWDEQRIREENDLAKELEAQARYAETYKEFGI